MKIYKYKMSNYLKSRIFRPFRSKSEILISLVDTVRELLISGPADEDADLIVIVSKFQRIFYLSDKKVYSLGFPFRVESQTQDGTLLSFGDGIEISNKLLSAADALIQEHFNDSDTEFPEFSVSMNEELQNDAKAWALLREFVMSEDCYIRYDFDEKHADNIKPEKQHKRRYEEPKIIKHPLHHIDVFYSPQFTFKIGLKKEIDYNSFLELVDPKSRCRILED